MSKKYTLTIGIPAHNEEANIEFLLRNLLAQNLHGLILEKIVVASDCSRDKTVEIVKEMSKIYSNIKVIDGKTRLGKPGRINDIFEKSLSDFMVIFDADVNIKSRETVYNLILPMIKDSKISLTSGVSKPEEPINFAQYIAYAGFNFWDKAREMTPNSDMYYCEGPIRAFRRDLYDKLVFPSTIAEDCYPYLFCMENGFKFRRSTNSEIKYTLPSTIADYVKQMTRAINTEGAQEKNFDKNLLEKYYTVGWQSKFFSFLYNFVKYPIGMIMYVALLSAPKIRSVFSNSKDSGIWNIVLSTKKI